MFCVKTIRFSLLTFLLLPSLFVGIATILLMTQFETDQTYTIAVEQKFATTPPTSKTEVIERKRNLKTIGFPFAYNQSPPNLQFRLQDTNWVSFGLNLLVAGGASIILFLFGKLLWRATSAG